MPMKNEKREDTQDRIMDRLIQDPTTSSKQMAEELGITRQKLWREKKRLEEENIVWGYTAVIDPKKKGHNLYVILFKSKALTEEAANLSISRVKGGEAHKEGIRVIDVLFINGPYDILLIFAAPDRQKARRYLENLKTLFKDHLLERPRLMDVTFPIIMGNKPNPEMEKFRELVP